MAAGLRRFSSNASDRSARETDRTIRNVGGGAELWDGTASATDTEGEIEPRIEHGLNTDKMLAGKELVPVSYDDGGIRAMALEHGEITEQITDGS